MNARWGQWVMVATAATISAILGFAFGRGTLIDLSELVKWQTSIAAIVALAAATLAYRAAMAKVWQDKEVAAQTLARKKLGLFLRLEFALDRLHDEAYGRQGLTEKGPVSRTVTLQQMRIAMPQELDEAWVNLDVFPGAVVESLVAIRTNMHDLRDIHDNEKSEEFAVNSGDVPNSSVIHATNRILARMVSHCIVAGELLGKEIKIVSQFD
jgi:hypothetical protein